MSYGGSESQKFFGLNTNGILVAISKDTYAARQVTAGAGIQVSNGTGVEGNIQVGLAPTGLIPGSYTNANIVVDEDGHITSVNNGSSGGGSGLSNTAPLALGPTALVGTSDLAMRADAVIQFPLASISQTITTAPGTIAASDHGHVIEWNAESGNLTLPADLPIGFNCLIRVIHATGVPTFVAASGAVIRQADAYDSARRQWSEVGVSVRTNSDGNSAEYVLSGDMQ